MTNIFSVLSNIQNKVLKSTFILLSTIVTFSVIMSAVSIWAGMSALNPWITFGVYAVLAILVSVYQNRPISVLLYLALFGWFGLILGPILSSIVLTNTAIIFGVFVLIGIVILFAIDYIVTFKKDLSMTGLITLGILVTSLLQILLMFFLKLSSIPPILALIFVISVGLLLIHILSTIIDSAKID